LKLRHAAASGLKPLHRRVPVWLAHAQDVRERVIPYLIFSPPTRTPKLHITATPAPATNSQEGNESSSSSLGGWSGASPNESELLTPRREYMDVTRAKNMQENLNADAVQINKNGGEHLVPCRLGATNSPKTPSRSEPHTSSLTRTSNSPSCIPQVLSDQKPARDSAPRIAQTLTRTVLKPSNRPLDSDDDSDEFEAGQHAGEKSTTSPMDDIFEPIWMIFGVFTKGCETTENPRTSMQASWSTSGELGGAAAAEKHACQPRPLKKKVAYGTSQLQCKDVLQDVSGHSAVPFIGSSDRHRMWCF